MNIEKTNQFGKIAISLEAIANVAGDQATLVYGVVGLVSKKAFLNPLGQFLKREDYADGVSVKKVKDGYEVSLYLVVSMDVKISEVTTEIQKQVHYALDRQFGMHFKAVNVFIQAVK